VKGSNCHVSNDNNLKPVSTES